VRLHSDNAATASGREVSNFDERSEKHLMDIGYDIEDCDKAPFGEHTPEQDMHGSARVHRTPKARSGWS